MVWLMRDRAAPRLRWVVSGHNDRLGTFGVPRTAPRSGVPTLTERVWDRFPDRRRQGTWRRVRTRPSTSAALALLLIDLYRGVFGEEPCRCSGDQVPRLLRHAGLERAALHRDPAGTARGWGIPSSTSPGPGGRAPAGAAKNGTTWPASPRESARGVPSSDHAQLRPSMERRCCEGTPAPSGARPGWPARLPGR
jgi:hypothetical protein